MASPPQGDESSLWCLEDHLLAQAREDFPGVKWSEISVGGEHICGVTEEAVLHCFGGNNRLFRGASSPPDFSVA